MAGGVSLGISNRHAFNSLVLLFLLANEHLGVGYELCTKALRELAGLVTAVDKAAIVAMQELVVVNLGGMGGNLCCRDTAVLTATGGKEQKGKEKRKKPFHCFTFICQKRQSHQLKKDALPKTARRSPHSLKEKGNRKPQLLLPYEHVDRAAVHGPVLTNLVLKETAIRLLDILREVGIEHERRYLRVRQL